MVVIGYHQLKFINDLVGQLDEKIIVDKIEVTDLQFPELILTFDLREVPMDYGEVEIIEETFVEEPVKKSTKNNHKDKINQGNSRCACGSLNVIRYGKRKNKNENSQRYICKDCNLTFTASEKMDILKTRLSELDKNGMPNTLKKISQELEISVSGNSNDLIRNLCKELGIELKLSNRGRPIKPRESEDTKPEEHKEVSTFTMELNKSIDEKLREENTSNDEDVSLEDQKYVELQRLYAHYTRGERLWDDDLNNPERRNIRGLEGSGFVKACVTKDGGFNRAYWEIEKKGIELIEDV